MNFQKKIFSSAIRPLLEKIMALKDETCKGGKISKERLAALLCTNKDGELETPLIIKVLGALKVQTQILLKSIGFRMKKHG